MPKVHVVLKKEDLSIEKLWENKIAVVFDVMFATSVITSALYHGAKEVIPVLNRDEALKVAGECDPVQTLLVGEANGRPIEGFFVPHPAILNEKVKGKTIILSTTNGTVAIRQVSAAKKVYIGSLLNSTAVAQTLLQTHDDEAIVIVCSGSSGAFCLEDFYGAGYFLDRLVHLTDKPLELTDAARAALLFYRGFHQPGEMVLKASAVARMLERFGLADLVEYIVGRDTLPVCAYLADERRILGRKPS